MDITTYVPRSGKQTIDKDPDSILYYGVDLTDYIALAGAGAALTGVTAVVAGVTLVLPATYSGNIVIAKLSSGDMTDLADNHCTFRFTFGPNGEQDDISIYFRMVKK